jgi:hypothetical protein
VCNTIANIYKHIDNTINDTYGIMFETAAAQAREHGRAVGCQYSRLQSESIIGENQRNCCRWENHTAWLNGIIITRVELEETHNVVS